MKKWILLNTLRDVEKVLSLIEHTDWWAIAQYNKVNLIGNQIRTFGVTCLCL